MVLIMLVHLNSSYQDSRPLIIQHLHFRVNMLIDFAFLLIDSISSHEYFDLSCIFLDF